MASLPNLPSSFIIEPGLPNMGEWYELLAAASTSEYGTVTVPREFLDALPSLPGVEPENDIVVVRDDTEEMVGVEFVQHTEPFVSAHLSGSVHPDWLNHGLGSALLDWGVRRAQERVDRAPEGTRVLATTSTSDTHQPSIALAEGAGFELERFFLEMKIDFDEEPEQPLLPPGIELRNFGPDDLEVLYDTVDESFRDHFGYVERSREEGMERWRAYTEIPGWDDSLVWLAFEGDTAVGANVCIGFHAEDRDTGYVATLGVRKPWRGLGLAGAMLRTCFSEFHKRGKTGAALHVDAESLTGATRLYESVGMSEVCRNRDYELELRPGEDIRVR